MTAASACSALETCCLQWGRYKRVPGQDWPNAGAACSMGAGLPVSVGPAWVGGLGDSTPALSSSALGSQPFARHRSSVHQYAPSRRHNDHSSFTRASSAGFVEDVTKVGQSGPSAAYILAAVEVLSAAGMVQDRATDIDEARVPSSLSEWDCGASVDQLGSADSPTTAAGANSCSIAPQRQGNDRAS